MGHLAGTTKRQSTQKRTNYILGDVEGSDKLQVISSIEDESGLWCVDLIELADDSYTFKVFRREPEDLGRWSLIEDHSACRYESYEMVIGAARNRAPWMWKNN